MGTSLVDHDIETARAEFDASFYLAEHPELAASGKDPVAHYLETGWLEGFDPHPGFSTRYYLARYPEVARAGMNPFLHYLRFGRAEGRSTLPPTAVAVPVTPGTAPGGAPQAANADPDDPAILASVDRLRPSFDAAFYLACHPEVGEAGLDPVLHYCLHGWAEGRDPHPAFSTRRYLGSHPEAARPGSNPFVHFLNSGVALDPSGPFAPTPDLEAVEPIAAVIRPHFDTRHYLQQYPEVAEAGFDPVLHYCIHGWSEGRDPTPDFSSQFYLSTNPEVARTATNPFWHYLTVGKTEGRAPMPVQAPFAAKPPHPAAVHSNTAFGAMDDVILQMVRPHFDSDFYLARNPEVAAAGIDPLRHYCEFGWREGRDPAPDFSTRFYLDSNPDVAAADVNPYWHYLMDGKQHGRLAQHPGGYKAAILQTLLPLEAAMNEWQRTDRLPRLLSVAKINEHLLRGVIAGRPRLIVSTSHDHYRRVGGGVQLCIQREEELSASFGATYLNLHPWQPLLRFAHPDQDPDPAMCLIVDGHDIGTARMSTVIAAIEAMKTMTEEIRVVIHHLMGHMPEQIVQLVKATGSDECWFWLHDYFSLCTSFTLQRNDVSFCGAPSTNSNACSLCRYGGERGDQVRRLTAMFEALRMHMISPSKVTREFWAARTKLPHETITVAPHMTLQWVTRKKTTEVSTEAVITVAFLGTPAPHKGWPIFERLVREFGQSELYRFVFLGTADVGLRGLARVPVQVTAENPDAMIDAVSAEKVDVVLHWASWPETFSFSTFEALAAGAYVLTNQISGNVADTIRQLQRGLVLADEAELFQLFEGSEIARIALERRKAQARFEVRHALGEISHPLLMRGEK